MFSAINQIPTSTSSIKPSIYVPTIIPKTDVVFQAVKPTNGLVNYVALVETGEEEDDEEPPFKQLYHSGNIYSAGPLATAASPDPFSLGKDPIKTFYIGSVTVVGLFILYKILTKTK